MSRMSPEELTEETKGTSKYEAHKRLVEAACQWLDREKNCVLILAEDAQNYCVEIPDAIGWAKLDQKDRQLVSYHIECKTSRKDFRDNRKKNTSVGHFRYFLAPTGLLKHRDMYDGWGLLEFDGNEIRLVKQAAARVTHGQERENYILMCIVRRTVLALRHIRELCGDQPLIGTFTNHFEDVEWEDEDDAGDILGSAIGDSAGIVTAVEGLEDKT